ncbi:hypothetical protein C2845_PM07G01970 [Panicum miliaceum]|uniref:Uncharacterized protein n=1 Tax=Panicum miliaceum TaxID=4540 RepID=A0A3L6SI50_PANMI|nr:hypothetical protein C2845_PM07G01970 [Panicum miliaceum]
MADDGVPGRVHLSSVVAHAGRGCGGNSPPFSRREASPHVLQELALVGWSPEAGKETTGTPDASASTVEFQPQCVTKHPTARCESTRPGSHHAATLPPAAAGGAVPGVVRGATGRRPAGPPSGACRARRRPPRSYGD